MGSRPLSVLTSRPVTIGLLTTACCEVSYCDLPEITEEALTRELTATNGAAAADVGPFYKQYRCIFGFVAQTCYVYVNTYSALRPIPFRRG